MCGIFAIFTHRHANNDKFKRLVYNGMSNIQHRGQDGYGIIILDNDKSPSIIKCSGLLPDYNQLLTSMELQTIFLGHIRYSTNTIAEKDNISAPNSIQPILINDAYNMYLAHNGNIPNLESKIKRLNLQSYYKSGTSDTFLFKAVWDKMLDDIVQEEGSSINLDFVINYIRYVLKSVLGAYSCVLTFSEEACNTIRTPHFIISDSGTDTEESMFSSFESEISTSSTSSETSTHPTRNNYLIGFRDRLGYKPLSIGYMADNYCFISESVQLKDGYKIIRDVSPGEIWVIKNNEEPILLEAPVINTKPFICSMESIYFMKTNSAIFGGATTVQNIRRRIGMELAKADKGISQSAVITFVPESAKSMADGYASYMGKTANSSLIVKIENIRSFIENSDDSRIGKLKRKFAFNIDDIRKLEEIILIDDSVVRGNTMKYLIQILYEINSDLRIHLRIGSPALVKGCHFGIDLYDDELIASKTSNLASYFQVASIEFLNLKTLSLIFAEHGMTNCQWCFGIADDNTRKTLDW
jgi:glutamine phosphoribosylpyrophosphate amidotransferase